MITDNERHERAKNFRDMISAREYGIPGKVGSFVDIDDLISELLDRRVYDSEVAIDACEALGIADLIDRPMCEMTECLIEHGSRSLGMRCSRCDTEFEHEKPAYGWRYCPECGAVITDAER